MRYISRVNFRHIYIVGKHTQRIKEEVEKIEGYKALDNIKPCVTRLMCANV